MPIGTRKCCRDNDRETRFKRDPYRPGGIYTVHPQEPDLDRDPERTPANAKEPGSKIRKDAGRKNDASSADKVQLKIPGIITDGTLQQIT
jgi:hypothetical protein